MEERVGGVFVDVYLKGYAELQRDLVKAKASLTGLTEAGLKTTQQFSQLTASTRGFQTMTSQVSDVSRQFTNFNQQATASSRNIAAVAGGFLLLNSAATNAATNAVRPWKTGTSSIIDATTLIKNNIAGLNHSILEMGRIAGNSFTAVDRAAGLVYQGRREQNRERGRFAKGFIPPEELLTGKDLTLADVLAGNKKRESTFGAKRVGQELVSPVGQKPSAQIPLPLGQMQFLLGAAQVPVQNEAGEWVNPLAKRPKPLLADTVARRFKAHDEFVEGALSLYTAQTAAAMVSITGTPKGKPPQTGFPSFANVYPTKLPQQTPQGFFPAPPGPVKPVVLHADSFKDKMAVMSDSLKSFAQTATRAFAIAGSSILGFFALADPRGFDLFTFSLQRVALQLGRFFIPLIHEATDKIMAIGTWLKSLTDGTRETVLTFAKVGLAVLAVTIILPKLFSLMQFGVGVISGFVKALTFVGIASPVGWIVAVTGALVGLTAVMDGSISERLGNAWGSLTSILTNLWNVISPVFTFIGNVAVTAISALASAIETLLPLLKALITYFVIFKVTLLAIGGAVSLWAGVFAAAGGVMKVVINAAILGIQGLAAALSGLLAHPVVAGIAAIAVAVLALSGAFSNTASAAARTQQELQAIIDLRKRLESGNIKLGDWVKVLPTKELRDEFQKVQKEGDETQKKAFYEKVKNYSETLLPPSVKPLIEGKIGEIDSILQQLEESKGRKPKEGEFRVYNAEEARREQEARNKVSADFLKYAETSSNQKIVDIAEQFKRSPGVFPSGAVREAMSDQRAEWEKRLEQPKLISTWADAMLKPSDRFRGEMRPQPPQLIPILEAWRKVQTAGENLLFEEQLKETRRIRQGIDKLVEGKNGGYASTGFDFGP